MSELLPFPGPFWFIVQQNQVKYITARRPKDVHVFEEPTFIETESVTEVFLDAKKGISGAIPGPKGSIFSNHPYIFHYDEFLQFQRAGLIVRYRIRLADFIVMMLYRHLKNTVKDLGWECNDDEVAAWVIQLYRGNYPSWFFRIERQSDEPNEYVQITRDKAKFTLETSEHFLQGKFRYQEFPLKEKCWWVEMNVQPDGQLVTENMGKHPDPEIKDWDHEKKQNPIPQKRYNSVAKEMFWRWARLDTEKVWASGTPPYHVVCAKDPTTPLVLRGKNGNRTFPMGVILTRSEASSTAALHEVSSTATLHEVSSTAASHEA